VDGRRRRVGRVGEEGKDGRRTEMHGAAKKEGEGRKEGIILNVLVAYVQLWLGLWLELG
jgi:hypothetical protein